MPLCNLSLAVLFMGQKLRSLPSQNKQTASKRNLLLELKCAKQQFNDKKKEDHDRHHGSTEMPLIQDDSKVWVTSSRQKGKNKVISYTQVQTQGRAQVAHAPSPHPSSIIRSKRLKYSDRAVTYPDKTVTYPYRILIMFMLNFK